jgi:hypothetical protein
MARSNWGLFHYSIRREHRSQINGSLNHWNDISYARLLSLTTQWRLKWKLLQRTFLRNLLLQQEAVADAPVRSWKCLNPCNKRKSSRAQKSPALGRNGTQWRLQREQA